jgi:hypothetical protein
LIGKTRDGCSPIMAALLPKEECNAGVAARLGDEVTEIFHDVGAYRFFRHDLRRSIASTALDTGPLATAIEKRPD